MIAVARMSDKKDYVNENPFLSLIRAVKKEERRQTMGGML